MSRILFVGEGARQLDPFGLDVSTAVSVRDAVAALARNGGELDAIICDLHLADGGGIKLYRFLEAEYPGMQHRMVFLRGPALSPREREFLRMITQPVLEKPYWIAGLIAIVRAWSMRRRRERLAHPSATITANSTR
ncbi:MAG TPA: hypothetical protein VEW48_09915 [Thermoanaerobaculia bacterium]|nr:hypothetical protein [Thermoanaerobaculia bacterium]